MNWIRKIIAFLALIVVFVVVHHTAETTVAKKQATQSNLDFSAESIHCTAFIQPHTLSIVSLQSKNYSNPIARWQDVFILESANILKINYLNTFLEQDINRCKKVSILLFPFHFFW
jgi:hypothetical protein